MQWAWWCTVGVLVASGARLEWTGQGTNNLWDNDANWKPVAIPTQQDDVIIANGQTVLVGTAVGASAKSLGVSGGSELIVQGASLTAGSLHVLDTSSFLIHAGAGLINVGQGHIDSTKGASWASGRIKGIWVVTAKSSLFSSAVEGQRLTCEEGHIQNSGSIQFQNSTLVDMKCLINNEGVVTLDGVSVLDIEATGSGHVSISGGVALQAAVLENVALAAKALVTFSAFGTATLKTVTMGDDSIIENYSSGGVLTVNGIKGSGLVAVDGGGIVDLAGVVDIHTLKVSSTCVIRNTKVVLHEFDLRGGTVSLLGSNSVVQTSVFNAGTATSAPIVVGNGSLSFLTGTVNHATRLAIPTTVGKTLVVRGDLTLDATLVVDTRAGIVAYQGTWGPSDASKPSRVELHGELEVAGESVTMNSVEINGRTTVNGVVMVRKGLLDVQHMGLYVKTLELMQKETQVVGEDAIVWYNTLDGPSHNATIELTVDGSVTTCNSPCGSRHPTQSTQYFKAAPR